MEKLHFSQCVHNCFTIFHFHSALCASVLSSAFLEMFIYDSFFSIKLFEMAIGLFLDYGVYPVERAALWDFRREKLRAQL